VNPEPLIQLLDKVVDDHMNEGLCKEFSAKEIGDALFQIGPIKAPGPDGFPARFFQRNWDILKDDVVRAVQHFFTTGVMPDGVNDTSVVLIPKKNEPETLKDFRPISLCNVVYKVVSKCLVNRLRPLLGDIICPTQSAFIPGRLITDNALIAFECVHALQKMEDDRGEFCAYKLDLAKAYDRVDWNTLERIMLKLGFRQTWVRWIMACVTTVRYSVKLNGEQLNAFSPTRGLRQGDPLSPYLFLFIANGLSCFLKDAIARNRLQELVICRGAPGISHLLFANDSLLFFKASSDQAEVVREVLQQFEGCTGQLLSRNKCSLMFGQKCSKRAKVWWLQF
jgi:hypothetical protein